MRDPLHFVSILNKTETYMKKKKKKTKYNKWKGICEQNAVNKSNGLPYCRGGENYKILFSCFNFQLLIFSLFF